MNQKALQTLEYNKIIAKLAEYATSPLGRDLCQALVPSSNLEERRSYQTGMLSIWAALSGPTL